MGTFEAIAISSVVDVPEDVQRAYFMGDQGINPFGGIEALLTHAVALLYDVPAAHAPMYDTFEIMNGDEGIYEPRKAAEGSSFAMHPQRHQGPVAQPAHCDRSSGSRRQRRRFR